MSNITKTVYCAYSGVPLVNVTNVCSSGWALLNNPTFHTLVHPTYDLDLGKLLRKLTVQLLDAEANSWCLIESEITSIALTMSAIMYSLGAMWQPNSDALEHGRYIEPSLPDQATTIGCAARLLELASWYHNETSKRITFPSWRPSKRSGNLNWHGFSNWLNACFEIQEEWNSVKRKRIDAELLDATTETLKTVRLAAVYKRIDIAKVWNWIELQAKCNSTKYATGRRETLKNLFLKGDSEPEAWLPDDCDDLIEMVTDCCDIGNEIMFYIRQRTTSIRASINDFYGNFTMLSSKANDSDGGLELTHKERTAQDSLLGEYNDKLLGLTSAPPEPQLVDFPNRVHWLRAQAEWRILTKLFNSRSASSASVATQQASSKTTTTGGCDAI